MTVPAGPALRDQFGQDWPWPPLAPVGQHPATHDVGPVPSRCWLFFLPGAFTPVCTAELSWVDELGAQLSPAGVGLRVVSCDSAAVLRALADDLSIDTPLLSDFWPHGAAAQAVGEFNENTGRPHRSSVLVDATGAVLSRIRAEPGSERERQAHLDAVK
ncbi:redoxin domain-containing protein [Citricoccus sp. GCM10030269]|uniref:redoxin domain-containing protein n=1 Tax=Citricoccus sp. GCM10030269 TaxID=3273388 RepID=UPI00361DEA72